SGESVRLKEFVVILPWTIDRVTGKEQLERPERIGEHSIGAARAKMATGSQHFRADHSTLRELGSGRRPAQELADALHRIAANGLGGHDVVANSVITDRAVRDSGRRIGLERGDGRGDITR